MKKRNPRYVATDETGYELAYIPAFNAADALKRAKQLYPGRKLKVTKTDEQMYIGRGAKEAEARERAARRAARAAAAPAKRVRRNGTHIHADMIDHLDVARVHNPLHKRTIMRLKKGRRRYNPQTYDHLFQSIADVWNAISGERVISRSRIKPYGNYGSGLILEEYEINEPVQGYLQVALDPDKGNDPVDWHYSEESEEDWMIG